MNHCINFYLSILLLPLSITFHFRFRREFIFRLFRCLQFPDEFQLDNGGWSNGQENLLVCLKFLAYPTRLAAEESFFGWEMTRFGRINRWIKQFIFDRHSFRIENHWDFFAPLLSQSKAAIQRKKAKLHPQGILNPRTFHVAAHYDGFRVALNRPSNVPNNPDLDIQALVFNNHVGLEMPTLEHYFGLE